MIVIRISEVMMQKTESGQSAKVNHRQVQPSMTLSRRYTKRPARSNDVMVKVKKSPKVQRFSTDISVQPNTEEKNSTMNSTTSMMQPAQVHPMQQMANAQMKARAAATSLQPQAQKMSAKELKDQAIRKALAAAEQPTQASKSSKRKAKADSNMHFGFGRVVLALGCAAVAVFAIVYFVNLNMPDISMRVAAMQTGIDSSYPNYVPRDYRISSITSEQEKIVMEFTNSNTDTSFTLSEEKSSWDTNALLSNYVKNEFGDNYTAIREQGLTIYISGSNAAWVNGGIMYKIETADNVLTNKQIRAIATSL